MKSAFHGEALRVGALLALVGGGCNDSEGSNAGPRGDAEAGTPRGDAQAGTPNAGRPLWNGVDLTQWSGDPNIWKVVGDAIVANAPAGSVTQNTFLIYQTRNFTNFVLTADIRVGTGGNSGIQYRSTVRNATTWVVGGYQADAGDRYWGLLYDERGRGVLAQTSAACLQGAKPADYNAFEILADGPLMVHHVNGIECIRYTEMAAGQPTSGRIALQYHMPGGFEVSIRNLRIREL